MRPVNLPYREEERFWSLCKDADGVMMVGATDPYKVEDPFHLTRVEYANALNNKDAEGNFVRQVHTDGSGKVLEGGSSFTDSVNTAIALTYAEGGVEAKERAALYAKACGVIAFLKVSLPGEEIRKGAGGKEREPAVPTMIFCTHLFNDDGTPGLHHHRLDNGTVVGPGGETGTRPWKKEELLVAKEKAFATAFNEAAVALAPSYLGLNFTMEAGRAVSKDVDALMIKEMGPGSRKEAMLNYLAEKGVEPTPFSMKVANQKTREPETKTYTFEGQLPAIKENAQKAIAGFEQRTGRTFYGSDPERRLPLEQLRGLQQKREADAAEYVKAVKDVLAARQEAKAERGPKVAEPKAERKAAKVEQPKQAGPKEKINIDTTTQPKRVEAKPQKEKKEPKPKEQKTQATPPPPPQTPPPSPEQKHQQQKAAKAQAREQKLHEEFFKDINSPAMKRIEKAVKVAITAVKMLAMSPAKKPQKEIVLTDRKEFMKLMFDASKKPQWFGRQEAMKAVRSTRVKSFKEGIDLYQKAMNKARKPTLKLSKNDKLTLSESLAKSLTVREQKAIIRLLKKTGCKVEILGDKKAEFLKAWKQKEPRKQQQQERSR